MASHECGKKHAARPDRSEITGRDVPLDAVVEPQPLALAIRRQVDDAVVDGVPDMSETNRPTGNLYLSLSAHDAGGDPQDGINSGAFQSHKPDDLATSDAEIDRAYSAAGDLPQC
jgi:hypothetical protein